MKENYKAWEVALDDFPEHGSLEEQLRFLVKFGVLAPSSHNSQPWMLSIGEGSLRLGFDMARALPVGDANHRQAFISLGCALENIIIAADYYGFKTRTVIRTQAHEPIAEVVFERLVTHNREAAHLIQAIPRRHTNRNKYQERMPQDDFIRAMKESAIAGTHLFLISAQEERDTMADVVLRAGASAMADSAFREELSHYIKSNITNSKVGMPGFGMGIPTPVSLIAPIAIKYVNMHNVNRKQEEQLLKNFTPMFCVIATDRDEPEDWINVGRTYERIALLAEQDSIKTAPMAAAVQIGDYYRELQTLLHTSSRPQLFFRIGYCYTPVPHSPRLPAEEIIHNS